MCTCACSVHSSVLYLIDWVASDPHLNVPPRPPSSHTTLVLPLLRPSPTVTHHPFASSPAHHQRINHFPNHYELTRKDLLVKNLKRTRRNLVRSREVRWASIERDEGSITILNYVVFQNHRTTPPLPLFLPSSDHFSPLPPSSPPLPLP